MFQLSPYTLCANKCIQEGGLRAIRKMFSTELKIEIKGHTINYVRLGNGAKNLLCFPGALGTIWSDFRPQIEGLNKDKFTVVAWDPPGYSCSRPPNRLFNINFFENDADFAHEFMQSLGITKYSLLGWSYGGISSLILAAKYPQNVDKLVVWGAYAYILLEDIKAYESIRDISNWSDNVKAPLIKLYTKPGLQNMWNDWCDTMVQIYKNGGDICKDCLKDINCPTLILHGDQDPIVLEEHPHYLLNHIKHAELHRYPKGKHNIHLKYANHFNRLVEDFILSN